MINIIFHLIFQLLQPSPTHQSLVQHHQQFLVQINCAMEDLMATMLSTATETTLSNVSQDQLTVKLAFHSLWNSVKLATNVCTANMTIVSPLNHGNQPPPSSVQTNALNVDQTSVETLQTHTMTDNTLLAGKELLLDALLVQAT